MSVLQDPSATVLDFPEPPRKRRRRYALILVSLAILALAGLLAFLLFSPALALKELEVRGNSLVPTEEVNAALAPLVGVPLTQISDDRVRDLLKDKAPIEDISVAAEPPSKLLVSITERTPVAIVQDTNGYVLLDSAGRQLGSVAGRDAVQLPLIDGGTAAVDSDVFPALAAVLAELPAGVLARLDHASASSPDSIQLSLSGDQKIFWGSAERNAAKARVLTALLAMPPADPPVKEFDVSTPDRPVTR
ncbi:cell division protein FtsQ/DivIB [Arthrobacter sp. Br18]|uniref:cell division protein FtsQ/DivIB n=1 Tax=Arthrobacter sp. Br18 TaxID=1312954 RepID=UPI0004AE8218|nr:cell division protein FtsQ/DivIB [Arthrobacter sp. Br18]